MEERHGRDRALVAATFAACAVVSFIVGLAFAANCRGEDLSFPLLLLLSGPSAGLACGFALVKGSRWKRIAGTLASIAVGLVWGGIAFVLAVDAWFDSCFVLVP
jgi:hypothetical protein